MQQAYSIREAARLLDLHPETLRRAVRRGELTVARIGGRILRVSTIELERWWQANGGGQLFGGADDPVAPWSDAAPDAPTQPPDADVQRVRPAAPESTADILPDATAPGADEPPAEPSTQVSLFGGLDNT